MPNRWGVFQDANNLAVIPLNDKREHAPYTTFCECEPQLEIVNHQNLYIHNSFDFREVAEELDDLANGL